MPISLFIKNPQDLDFGYKIFVENFEESKKANHNQNECDDRGNNILHLIAEQSRYESDEMIRYIIEQQVSIDHQNNHGDTPLHIFLKKSYFSSALILVKKGAKNIQNSSYLFPIEMASYNLFPSPKIG